MKKLFLMLTLCFCLDSFADSYMSGSHVAGVKLGTAGLMQYKSEQICEASEGEACYRIDGKNLMLDTVQSVMVPDYSSPLFESKSKISPCTNATTCAAVNQPGYCDSQGPNHFSVVAGDFSEVYCTRRTGFNQKAEDQLVRDPALQAAQDAVHAAEEADTANRNGKRATRSADLKTCLATLQSTVPPPSLVDVIACLEKLLKHVVEKDLLTSEL